MKYALYATLLLTLSGCGNISNIQAYSTPYAEPTAGDTARVRVITNGMVRGVPGRDCIDWRVPGSGGMAVAQSGFANRNGQNLGMSASDMMVEGENLVRTELKVPGNKPFAVNFQSKSSYGASCQQSFQFNPAAGQDYELIVLDSGSCLVSLQRLNPTGRAVRENVEKAKLCNAMDAF